ncbi:TadE/TadG family type IV pilus assembly protein [Sphingomonas sp. LR60]|uniref:TadE/TadG family type IV pilus assembly protein n=1 Tax=Sphingomonas sp. LR60 TaxID=3050233 RepID=UPI002FE1E69E
MQLTTTRATLRRLLHNTSGVALLEFAITAPTVLLLGLGGVEMGNFVSANLRVSQIAMSVADNAGRVRTTIDEADISEIMLGAMKMGEPLDVASNGRIILSDLEQRTTTTGANGKGATSSSNPDGFRQWIRWQRCAGAMKTASSYGVPRNGSGGQVTDLDSTVNDDHGAVEAASTIDGMGPTNNQIAAVGGTAVMVVELVYTYKPLIPISLITTVLGTPKIRRVMAFNVRQRTAYSLRNDAALTGTKRADCTIFSAAAPTP